MYEVEVKREAERGIREKLYTIYSKWVKADPTVPQGSFVKVRYGGEHIGYGFYEKIGAVGLRILAYVSEGPPDDLDGIIKWRLERAHALRKLAGETPEAGYRLVYADSDGMPGLIIDVYGRTSVVQTSSLGWDSNIDRVASTLTELGISERVYLKNDQRGRKEFGLPVERRFLVGSGPEREVIREGRALFIVDFKAGQKTGFYLDQRPARVKISSMKLDGLRILDLFAYNGSFSVQAMLAGASSAMLVEESQTAIKIARENMILNGLENYEIVRGRVEKVCETLASKRRKFDLVISDPPAFIPSKELYEKGLRAYEKMIESVLKLVEVGGLAYVSSCSYFLSESELLGLIERQASRLGLSTKILFHNSPANSCPYTRPVDKHLRYLKGFLLKVE